MRIISVCVCAKSAAGILNTHYTNTTCNILCIRYKIISTRRRVLYLVIYAYIFYIITITGGGDIG